MFRALGHPTRLSIVRLLMERRQCVCDVLVDELPLAQATVSQHLKVLKEAGIVVGEVFRPGNMLQPGPRRAGRVAGGRGPGELTSESSAGSRSNPL